MAGGLWGVLTASRPLAESGCELEGSLLGGIGRMILGQDDFLDRMILGQDDCGGVWRAKWNMLRSTSYVPPFTFCFPRGGEFEGLHGGFVGAFVHAVIRGDGGVVFEAFEGEFGVFEQAHLGKWWFGARGNGWEFKHGAIPRRWGS